MHSFRPTRVSPPLLNVDSTTTSNAPESISPELQSLSARDIEILDAVIQRAGASAKSFFPIFKAYSDVLKEKGLDLQEVVYYGKLLKLGTMKGENWGEKWDMVKTQLEHKVPSTTSKAIQDNRQITGAHVPGGAGARSRKARNPPLDFKPIHLVTAAATHLPRSWKSEVPKSNTIPCPASYSDISQGEQYPYPTSSIASEDVNGHSSPVPPSYKSSYLDPTLQILQPQPSPTKVVSARCLPHVTAITQQALVQPKSQKRAINLDDAWKNIEMEKYEEMADCFRQEMLLARCLDVWIEGLQWIITTHRQVVEAREQTLVHSSLQTWQARFHTRATARESYHSRLIEKFDKARLKPLFSRWQTRWKQRRQVAWRNDMRQKMKLIKNNVDLRIGKDSWAKWRQLHLLHRADKYYMTSLLIRHYERWKNKLEILNGMDSVMEQFSSRFDLRILQRNWNIWRVALGIRHDQLAVEQRVNQRVLTGAFNLWKHQLAQCRMAEKFSSFRIKKHTIALWKSHQEKLKAMDDRASKYIKSQNGLLLQGVVRIWRTKARGKLLRAYRHSTLVKNVWKAWKRRIHDHQLRMDQAIGFHNRPNSQLIVNTIIRWHQVRNTHQNAHMFAFQHYHAHLCTRVFLRWRLRLHESHQTMKVARWANRFFATRRAWRTWIERVEERQRQKRLQHWEQNKIRKFLEIWWHRTRQEQCAHIVRDRLMKRTVQTTLNLWIRRVVEIKSRELDVAQRYATSLQAAAFQKWKTRRMQHIEALSLLENQILVKQDAILRRMFRQWLATARSREHRRQTHQRKEAQLRESTLLTAWEKWRERLKEERLRPLEYEIILHNQRNTIAHATQVWRFKTRALPAIQFHCKHVKENFFKAWRDARPYAAQTRKAREIHKLNALGLYFRRWAETYKTKTTLKAVARAKYLRAPIHPPRPPIFASRPLSTSYKTPLRSAYSTDVDTSSPADESEPLAPSQPLALRSRFTPRSSSRPRSSPSRSEAGSAHTRPPSPVRSIVTLAGRTRSPSSSRVARSVASAAAGENRLWLALKDARRF